MTLIEITVGLAIIAIVSSLSMAGWQSFARYQTEADFNNLEISFRTERASALANFPSTDLGQATATTVERMVNNQKRVFYITEAGAILDHLP